MRVCVCEGVCECVCVCEGVLLGQKDRSFLRIPWPLVLEGAIETF